MDSILLEYLRAELLDGVRDDLWDLESSDRPELVNEEVVVSWPLKLVPEELKTFG